MAKFPKPFVVLLITLTCVGSDQATKLVAKRYLVPHALFSYAADMAITFGALILAFHSYRQKETVETTEFP
ncbi:MAG: hypothetical protein ACREOR_02970 [Candidatus Binatia bacterium]